MGYQASRAAMVREGNQVRAEDVASLQRYDPDGHCDSFGQDRGAEIESGDDGQYILLSDALSLFTKP